MMFFDDRLAMPGIYGGSVAEAVRLGARPVKLDLSIVLGLVAGATRSHRARRHLLDDLLLAVPRRPDLRHPRPPLRRPGGLERGHVGERQRGPELRRRRRHLGHDARYDRADEFLEATTGLWDTWEDDALVLDRASGHLRRPRQGPRARLRGRVVQRPRARSPCPARPQGRPVLLQAGSSGRGRDFAARWAELIFTGDPGIDVARSHYKDQKERIAEAGRDPDAVKMLPMAYTVVGESTAHAEEREQLFLNDLVDPMASLTLLSELMNYDFSGMALDAPITDELIESVSGIRGLVQNLRQHIGDDSHPRRPGRPPGHAAAGPPLRRHRPPRSPTRWRSGSRPTPATASSSPPPTRPAPTRTSCAWSCPSSSAAGSSATGTPGTTLRDHLGLARPEVRRSCLTAARSARRRSASSRPPRSPPARWSAPRSASSAPR